MSKAWLFEVMPPGVSSAMIFNTGFGGNRSPNPVNISRIHELIFG
jgi:hypothetical protein